MKIIIYQPKKKHLKLSTSINFSLLFCLVFSILILHGCSSNKETKGDNKLNATKDEGAVQMFPVAYKILNIDTTFFFNDTTTIHLKINSETIQGATYNGYLDNKIHLVCSLNNKETYNNVYDKKSFDIKDRNFIDQAILFSFDIEKFDYVQQKVVLSASITKPETDWVYLYEIEINGQGKLQMFYIQDDGSRKLAN